MSTSSIPSDRDHLVQAILNRIFDAHYCSAPGVALAFLGDHVSKALVIADDLISLNIEEAAKAWAYVQRLYPDRTYEILHLAASAARD